MAKFKSTLELVEEVNSVYDYRIEQIRNDSTRTDEWKRQALAAVWIEIKAAREKAISDRDAEMAKHKQTLEYRVFGPGSSTITDSATLVISRRDAGDRAEQLEHESDALLLLKKADRLQDEPLARAVAEKAFDMGWADVLNTFTASRPKLEPDVEELWTTHGPSLREDFIGAWAVHNAPPELANLSEYQIKQIAEQASA